MPFLRVPSIALVLSGATLLPLALSSQEVVDLPARDQSLSADQEEVFSVGSIAGEDWETFSTVTGVAFDGVGNLYILDRQNFRVVKVSPQGELITEMGRAGGGPGEFGMPLSISVTSSGEVRVFDMGKQGFIVFNPDGSFERTVPLAGGGMIVPNGGLLSLPNGDIVDGGSTRFRMTVFDGREDRLAPRPVHRFTLADDAEITTAYEAWNPRVVAGAERDEVVSGGGVQVSAPPLRAFDPELFVGVLPSGMLAVADSTTYAINVVGPNGNPVRTIRRPFKPKEVTRRDQAAERDRRLEEIAAREESGGGGGGRAYSTDGSGTATITVGAGQVSELLRARVESMEFGEEIPVISGMAVDWEGRIWVERTGPRVGEAGPVDLIGSDSRYLGTVGPGEFRIPDAFGPQGLAAYIETDEMDVPRVVVKRVTLS